jgi:glycosyltransferase involved in cell wall biosynthesis
MTRTRIRSDERMKRASHTVLAVMTIPPPTHGQAIVNKGILDALLTARVPIKLVNTSPGTLQRDVRYHLKRLRLHILHAIPSILSTKVSTVYSSVESGYGMYYNYLIVLSARTMRHTIVLHHHSASYTKVFHLRFDLLSWLAGKDALHIVLDEPMRKDIKARYQSVAKVIVAHNASHAPQASVDERANRPLTCGFMSNLSCEKGLDTFIDCLRAARSAGLDLHAILAGSPTSSEAEKIIDEAKNDLGDLLTVLGPVSGASKDRFFKSIDVFLFPTRYKYEAQPLVILESMSHGVPIVATNHGYCTELIGSAGITASTSEFVISAIDFLTRCRCDVDYWVKMQSKVRSRYELLRLEANAQLNNLVEKLCFRGK